MKTIRFFALAALALVAFMPERASAQSSGGITLTACYVPKSGTVYRIKVAGAPDKCAQNHVEFSWTTGATTTVQVTEVGPTQYILAGGEYFQIEIAGPAGSVPISGGFMAGTEDVKVYRSIKYNPNPQAWAFAGLNTGAFGSSVTLSVLCLKS